MNSKIFGLIFSCTFSFLCLFLLSGCQHTIHYGTINPPPAPPIIPEPAYTSTLAVSLFGDASISGRVFRANDGDCCYSDHQSGSLNTQVKLAGSRIGTENEKCGENWTRSRSSAVAEFTPQPDESKRLYGFALSTELYGRGGHWRGYTGPFCSGSYDETGYAKGYTSGRIDLVFNSPTPTISDRLIIRVSGSTPQNAKITLKEVGGKDVPIRALSNGYGMVADLPKPGPYTLEASVSSEAAGGGGCPYCEQHISQNVNISVQSLRDALKLGYGDGASPTYEIPLKVDLPIKDVEKFLKDQLFTNDNKFYPCTEQNGCDEVARDVYLEWPELSIDGAWIVMKFHFSGNLKKYFLRPGVTGNGVLTWTPIITKFKEGGKDIPYLVAGGLALDVTTKNEIVEIIGKMFSDKIVQQLDAKSKFSLVPWYNKATEEINKKFPINWGPGYLDLDVTDINLTSITTVPSEQKIVAFAKVKIIYKDKLKVLEEFLPQTRPAERLLQNYKRIPYIYEEK